MNYERPINRIEFLQNMVDVYKSMIALQLVVSQLIKDLEGDVSDEARHQILFASERINEGLDRVKRMIDE